MVARELCLFITVDASRAPKKQRRDFVALAARRAAPFPHVGFDVAWGSDGHASVWYWSRDRISHLLGAETARRINYVAEPLYVGEVDSDSAVLLGLDEGVEGRIWKHGRLVASRWWTSEPSEVDWRLFLRSAGMACDGDTAVPPMTRGQIANKSWGSSASTPATLRLPGLEEHLPKLAISVGGIFIFLSLAQMGAAVRARIDIWQARSASEELDTSLKRILSARERADADLDKINRLLSLRAGHSQTYLLAEAVDLMPDGPWRLRAWNQTAPDTIEVSIISPQANPEQMVAKWESSPLYKNVTTSIGRDDELTIKATIASKALVEIAGGT